MLFIMSDCGVGNTDSLWISCEESSVFIIDILPYKVSFLHDHILMIFFFFY